MITTMASPCLTCHPSRPGSLQPAIKIGENAIDAQHLSDTLRTVSTDASRGEDFVGDHEAQPHGLAFFYTKDPFLLAMKPLATPAAIGMMDYLESLDPGAQVDPSNGRFGTRGMDKLAQLTPASPEWDQVPAAAGTTPAQRAELIAAAATARAPENAALLNEVHQGDGIFEQNDIPRWLGLYLRPTPKVQFAQAIEKLVTPAATGMMDYLEWLDPGAQVDPNNGRFGTRGLEQLSQLTPSSPAWNQVPAAALTTEAQRAELIAAAAAARSPENAPFVNEALGGDQISDKGELGNWLNAFDAHTVSDGFIDPSRQAWLGDKHWSDCFVLGSLNAVSQSPAGQKILAESMVQNLDGSYTLTLRGDPSHPITVTEQDLADIPHAEGDKDVAIWEVAFEKYARTNPAFNDGKGTIGEGGYPEEVLQLLTGNLPGSIANLSGALIGKGTPQSYADRIRDRVLANPQGVFTFAAPTDFEKGGKTGGHAYTVTHIDPQSNLVTFTNPFDSGRPVTMTIDELASKIYRFSALDLS